MANVLTPSYLCNLLPLKISQRSSYASRFNDNYSLIPTRTERFKTSFLSSVISLWNDLNTEACTATSFALFKTKIRNMFYANKYNKLDNTSRNRYSSSFKHKVTFRSQCS
jgi:hypothetical protein